MKSYRRGLRNGTLVDPKLFILEKVNFGQHTKCWSNLVNLVKLGQTCCKLVLFGTGHYIKSWIRVFNMSDQTVQLGEMKAIAQLKPIDPLLGRTGLYNFETLLTHPTSLV